MHGVRSAVEFVLRNSKVASSYASRLHNSKSLAVLTLYERPRARKVHPMYNCVCVSAHCYLTTCVLEARQQPGKAYAPRRSERSSQALGASAHRLERPSPTQTNPKPHQSCH
jgi:hypothetical protein